MYALPPGFEETSAPGAAVFARADVLADARRVVATHGTLHAWAAAQPEAVPLRGRATAWRVPAPGGAWVVRHYHRGGAMAALLGDRYLRRGDRRPLLELWASERARRRGVATPPVQCAILYPAGAFYRADIATTAVPGAVDLAAATFGDEPLPDAELAGAWHAAGALLAGAFAAGVDHPDLNLMNVLLEPAPAGPRAWLIDLDRAQVGAEALPAARRGAILRRFHRSREKLATAAGRPVPATALGAFEEGLAAAAEAPTPAGEQSRA